MAAIGRESPRRAIWEAGEPDSIQPFTGAVPGEPGTLTSIRAWIAKAQSQSWRDGTHQLTARRSRPASAPTGAEARPHG